MPHSKQVNESSGPTGYDKVAVPYQFLEMIAFGSALQRIRERHIQLFSEKRRVLVLGDGNGRFLERFATHHPDCTVTSVDASPAMVRIAQKRIKPRQATRENSNRSRFRWVVADALRMEFPTEHYDLVVTQFFLDNFRQETVDALIPSITATIIPGGHWLYTDFAVGRSAGRWRWRNRLWLFGLYRAFRATCGIEASRLPDAHQAMRSAGLRPVSNVGMLQGLLESTVYQKP
jgi:ubiquinone/menaquinone biosynthesis C-methylase UbiE